MSVRKQFFVLLVAVLVISSCSSTTKINTLKPEPEDGTPLIYDNKPSFISMPVVLKINDIENQTLRMMVTRLRYGSKLRFLL
jgi:hypothetical protein